MFNCGFLFSFALLSVWSGSCMYFYFLLQDKYKRALADTENIRQRSKKMVEDSKLFGKL